MALSPSASGQVCNLPPLFSQHYANDMKLLQHSVAAQSSAGSMTIPLELLQQTGNYLEKDDFANLRLVSKYFNQAFLSRLFDSIMLIAHTRKLQHAKLIASRFSGSVRTVYLAPINYPAITEATYGNTVKRLSQGSKISFCELHLKLGYKAYCKLRKEQQEIMASREISMVLCQILSQAPSVVRVIVTKCPLLDRISPANLPEYCPLANCGLSVNSHNHLMFSPSTPQECNMSFAPSIILALSTAPRAIKDIIAEPEEYYLRVPAASLRIGAHQARNLTPTTAALTRLALTVDVISSADNRFIADGLLAAMLSAATRLTCLLLRFTTNRDRGSSMSYSKFVPFEAVFKDCCFPLLQDVLLMGMESSVRGLTSLLGHSPSIERLAVYHHKLTPDEWFSFAELLRRFSSLKNVEIFKPFGNPVNPESPEPIFYSDRGMMGTFLFEQGENPFAEGAFDRYKQTSPLVRSLHLPDYRDWFRETFSDVKY